jgi:hypothetical protein
MDPGLRRESDPVAVSSRACPWLEQGAGRPPGRWPTRNDHWSWWCNLIGIRAKHIFLWRRWNGAPHRADNDRERAQSVRHSGKIAGANMPLYLGA